MRVQVKNHVLRAEEFCSVKTRQVRFLRSLQEYFFTWGGPKQCVVACGPPPAPCPGVELSKRRQMSPGPPKASNLPPAALAGGKSALNAQASNLNELAPAF